MFVWLQVLYHVFSELSEIGEQNVIAVDVVLGVISFFVVVIGSVGIGTLLGLAGSFSARFTHHMRVMEPMIVVVIPYLAFIVAEMFHLSGIIAYVRSVNAVETVKRLNDTALLNRAASVTCHKVSHSVTCHPTQVNTPRLTPARQAGTRLTYPEGWKAEYVRRRFPCQ